MKETPILFTPDNIRLILGDLKDETRRFCQWPLMSKSDGVKKRVWLHGDLSEVRKCLSERQRDPMRILCPWGQVGDRLWVREAWAIAGDRLIDPCLNYKADGKQRPINKHKDGHDFWYPYGSKRPITSEELMKPDLRKLGWRSALFMPKWTARLWLEITKVKVERVQEISPQDARAEGVEPCTNCVRLGRLGNCQCHVQYKKLWDSINGKRHPWASNPWVWALTFRRLNEETL